ncbi:TetR/AcrR family transcriptional regulator [Solirubrobacter sp. CPCC 204708]|uniref:TetR/AcrR family transcriptional regulator n=1 Tax=Solirubrobacter deserti TaxID=2282478 RepID=A0ABT4RQ28_9ACTN|nr:TetR/AcrR family transcriptional regulator [Solirubrobacter deserti]MBE2318247.1 TetR/AcrR family transcriptional regulator [Solirubrobacter deserti]MDA0140585.1 TetR/AcrR family transcriptional regulator [Solirubrobacter deserti]
MTALPVLNAEPPERADAARNRQRVLEAAERLFEEDPDGVTMEAVAAAAGVGKGTVFRRFGDRAGLARAVISPYEAEMQEQMIRGAPPLGPGAPARQRLIAFGIAYLRFLERHSALVRHAEGTESVRLISTVYTLYRTHLTLLLREADCGDSAPYLADVLMAPLAATTFIYHRHVRGLSLDALITAYEDLIARLID